MHSHSIKIGRPENNFFEPKSNIFLSQNLKPKRIDHLKCSNDLEVYTIERPLNVSLKKI